MSGFLPFLKSRVVLSALAALVISVLPSIANAQSTGTVRLKVAKAGFIFGVGGGNGTLTYKGRTYPLRVSGLSAGTIGVAQADLVGTASNLRNATDIVGTYSALSAGAAVAGGGKGVTLQNGNGVVLILRGAQVGFEASFAMSGVNISMQ